MTEQSMFPDTVFTLWIVTIVLALVVFVPLSVYMLASLLRTARSIQHYAREIVVAGAGDCRQHGGGSGARQHNRGGYRDAGSGGRRRAEARRDGNCARSTLRTGLKGEIETSCWSLSRW